MMKRVLFLRFFRIFKIIKYQKYDYEFKKIQDMIDLKRTVYRIFILLTQSCMFIHLFACIFFFSARLNDFGTDTWVYQTGNLDGEPFDNWALSVYWASQTITTVGYGDFGAYNSYEIMITLMWMFIGVAFYTVVVGSFTVMIEET